MKNFLTGILMIFSLVIFAQKSKIKGIVTDSKTNEPLIGVNISVQNTSLGTSTDISGNYEIELETGEQIIVFSYVGYEDKIENVLIKNNEIKILNVAVGENDNILNTVVVSGSKFEKKLSEEIVSMDVIKPAMLEKQHITDIGGAIKKNPGVTIVDGQINIRGGSGFSYGAGSRVLVLLDGLSVLNPGSGGVSGSLPMESVGQIEIIKGAASALYGSSAMNGIINLRTTFATTEPHTNISFFGSVNDNPNKKDNYIDADGNLQSENIDKRWWRQDSITFHQPDLLKLLGNRDTTLKNENSTRPYSFGMSFSNRQKIGKLDLIIGGLFNKGSGMSWGTAYTAGRFNINTRYRFTNKWSAGININMGFGKSGNQFLWSGYRGVDKYLPNAMIIPTTSAYFNATIDPFLNYSDDKGNRHKLTGRYLVSANNNTNNQSNSSTTYYAEYQYQRKIDKINMTFTTGAVGGYNTAPGSALYGNKKLVSSNIGMYLQVDNKFWKRLNTSFGFRLESNKITDSKREVKPVFRAGVNIEAAKYTFIRASFGQGYRFPTIAEKFVSTDLGGFAILPNPYIKSETGMSVELGIKQGVKMGKNFRAFLDISGFYTQYSSMMEFTLATPESGIPVPPNVVLGFASQNVGNTRIYGTEISMQGEGKFFGFPTTAVLGYTFIVPQYRKYVEANTDDIVDYNVLKYRFRHTFTGQWDVDFKGFGLGTNIQYFSFIENYDELFNTIGVGLTEYRRASLKKDADKKKEKNKYKGTAIWDVRASYTFGKTSRYTLAFIVNNVLNKEYSLRPGVLENNRNYNIRVDMKF